MEKVKKNHSTNNYLYLTLKFLGDSIRLSGLILFYLTLCVYFICKGETNTEGIISSFQVTNLIEYLIIISFGGIILKELGTFIINKIKKVTI